MFKILHKYYVVAVGVVVIVVFVADVIVAIAVSFDECAKHGILCGMTLRHSTNNTRTTFNIQITLYKDFVEIQNINE